MDNRQLQLTKLLFIELLKNNCFKKDHAPCAHCLDRKFCDILYDELCKYSDEEPLVFSDEDEDE